MDTNQNSIPVPVSFLEKTANSCSAHTLNNDPKISTGKVLLWNRKYWVCTNTVSQYLEYLEADLREVVPEGSYTGPPPSKHNYTGMRFRHVKARWVITGHQVTLVPNGEPEEMQLALFYMEVFE
jgi:hypothetical protein